MPRNQHKVMKKNPIIGDFIKKLMGSICEVKKIESATRSNIDIIFDGSYSDDVVKKDLSKNLLTDLVIDIITEFRIDSALKSKIILIGPSKDPIDKKNEYTLPPHTENTLHRVILVSGTHELFFSPSMSVLTGDESFFCPQGSAMKVSSSIGELKYDDRGYYDKNKYAGKGFKRPESRHIVIVDFLTEDKELLKKNQSNEISKAGENLCKSISEKNDLSGLIKNAIKNFESKK